MPSLPAESPEAWATQHLLADDTVLCLRPLRSDDRGREVAFVRTLSERTIYFRMLTPLRFLSRHVLDQLMDVNYHDRMAIAASVQIDDKETFVGIARYGLADRPDTVEMGITVTDAWQRKGISRLLLGELIRYARDRGFRKMTGMVLPENARMLALARSFGFRTKYSAEDLLMHIELDLQETAVTTFAPPKVSLQPA